MLYGLQAMEAHSTLVAHFDGAVDTPAPYATTDIESALPELRTVLAD